jgi:UDPglucose 6-dehydrogenase
VIELLLNAGAKVVAYDPVAIPEAKEILADKIKFVSDKYDALENADAIFLITEWKEFFELNFNELNKMKTKVIFDGRNIYDKKQMLENNIDYISIGR